jgi:hypothetical protein
VSQNEYGKVVTREEIEKNSDDPVWRNEHPGWEWYAPSCWYASKNTVWDILAVKRDV